MIGTEIFCHIYGTVKTASLLTEETSRWYYSYYAIVIGLMPSPDIFQKYYIQVDELERK